MAELIALNGRVTARPRISGVERMAHEVLGRLLALRPQTYHLLAPSPRHSAGVSAHAWEQLVLPSRAARLGASLIYSPANLAPIAFSRNVVVLHDAAVWRRADSYSRAYSAMHRLLEGASARRSLGVVTVSEFSKRELVESLGLDPDSIAVVPNGVSEIFHPRVDPETVRAAYELQNPYVLSVAMSHPTKNLVLLGRLAQRLASDGIDVVHVGDERPHIISEDLNAAVRSLGYVPDRDLPGLYRGAAVVVVTSTYEGFGLPCLEAMACGTPVVAADRAALPGTCGGAALLFDPDDQESFVAAVRSVIGDQALRTQLRDAGMQRAAQFTWDEAARRTDEILLRLAS